MHSVIKQQDSNVVHSSDHQVMINDQNMTPEAFDQSSSRHHHHNTSNMSDHSPPSPQSQDDQRIATTVGTTTGHVDNNNNNDNSDGGGNDEDRRFLDDVLMIYHKNPTFLKLAFQLLTPHHMHLLTHTLPMITPSSSSPSPPSFNWNSIKYLDLTGNLIKSDGCQIIAHLLAHNTSIEVLNLSMNDISASGALCLCQVLTNDLHNQAQLQQQQQEEEEEAQLQQEEQQRQIVTIPKNFTLKHLDLSMNRLGNDGMQHLSHMLRHNHTLVTLSVRSNKVKSQEGVSHIMEMLAIAHYSETLQEVFV